MDNHTKHGVKTSWGDKQATSRSKRTGSSAPTPEELVVYEKWLVQALGGQPSGRVLVLGATPELRDLALKHGCEVTAADISQPMLEAMTAVMELSQSSKNKTLCSDWLELGRKLPARNFDVILADVSLNNVSAEKHGGLLADLSSLLVAGGYLITRNAVYLPDRPRETSEEYQKKYDAGRTTWLMYWIGWSYYGDPSEPAYNPATKQWSSQKSLHEFFKKIDQGRIKLRAEDVWKIQNVKEHGERVVHITFPRAEFEKLLLKRFEIVACESSPRWEYTDFAPIYVVRTKS